MHVHDDAPDPLALLLGRDVHDVARAPLYVLLPQAVQDRPDALLVPAVHPVHANELPLPVVP